MIYSVLCKSKPITIIGHKDETMSEEAGYHITPEPSQPVVCFTHAQYKQGSEGLQEVHRKAVEEPEKEATVVAYLIHHVHN